MKRIEFLARHAAAVRMTNTNVIQFVSVTWLFVGAQVPAVVMTDSTRKLSGRSYTLVICAAYITLSPNMF